MKKYIVKIGDYWGAGQNSGWTGCLQYSCSAKSAQEAGDKAVKFAQEKNINDPIVIDIKTDIDEEAE